MVFYIVIITRLFSRSFSGLRQADNLADDVMAWLFERQTYPPFPPQAVDRDKYLVPCEPQTFEEYLFDGAVIRMGDNVHDVVGGRFRLCYKVFRFAGVLYKGVKRMARPSVGWGGIIVKSLCSQRCFACR